MKLPDDTRVPLDMNKGLMTFTIRKPTEDELEDQDFVWHDLTSDTEWSPRDMTDDNDATSFDSTIATAQTNLNDDEQFFDCEPVTDTFTPLVNSGGFKSLKIFQNS